MRHPNIAALALSSSLSLLIASPAAADRVYDVARKPCLARKLPELKDLFGKNVPAAGIFGSFAKRHRQHGRCKRVERGKGPHVRYVHDKVIVPGRLYLDKSGKIAGIWFSTPVLTKDSTSPRARAGPPSATRAATCPASATRPTR